MREHENWKEMKEERFLAQRKGQLDKVITLVSHMEHIYIRTWLRYELRTIRKNTTKNVLSSIIVCRSMLLASSAMPAVNVLGVSRPASMCHLEIGAWDRARACPPTLVPTPWRRRNPPQSDTKEEPRRKSNSEYRSYTEGGLLYFCISKAFLENTNQHHICQIRMARVGLFEPSDFFKIVNGNRSNKN